MKTQKSKTGRPQRSRQLARHSATRRKPSRDTLKQYRSSYPVHKRLMLHPMSMFLFLCAGVFMGGWTYQVAAATIISSTVQAQPLQTGATISAPQADARTASSTATVSGGCPTASYVTLTVNNSYSGTAMCGTNSTYEITSSLYPGNNTLRVQDYNITDAAGPATDPIQLTYNAPALPVIASSPTATNSISDSGSISTGTSSSSVPPILLTSAFHFETFTSQQTFNWTMDLEGGLPPYVVTIEWGDGTSSILHFAQDPVFHIHHNYTTPGYYPVIVKSVDIAGQMHTIQLAALITDTNGHASFLGPSGGTSSQPTASSSSGRQSVDTNIRWLFLAWPTYIIIVLMTVSFWLGEKREFVLIPVKNHRTARR